MSKRKRKVKKKSFLILFIFVFILGFGIYYVFFSEGTLSNEIGETFDLVLENITKSTEAYKTCMSEEVLKEEDFSDSLLAKRDEIISLYNGVNANFMYTDLESDYSFGEGEDSELYAASVTKLLAVLYAYKLADDGKLDLNKELTYLAKYKIGGSGIIQNDSVGTKYKLSTILEYTIVYSDNIGYSMLLDELGGRSKIKEYWASLGYDIHYSDNFGNLSPSLGNGYIKEVYKYYLEGTDNAKKLVDDMKKSDNLEYVKSGDIEVAHKYGEYVEGGGYYNDVSLNFTEHPFALSITSTLGLTDKMKNLFLKTHELSIEFNNLYYEEKGNYCMEKSQILG